MYSPDWTLFERHRQRQGYLEEGFASHLHNEQHSSPLSLAMPFNAVISGERLRA